MIKKLLATFIFAGITSCGVAGGIGVTHDQGAITVTDSIVKTKIALSLPGSEDVKGAFSDVTIVYSFNGEAGPFKTITMARLGIVNKSIVYEAAVPRDGGKMWYHFQFTENGKIHNYVPTAVPYIIKK